MLQISKLLFLYIQNDFLHHIARGIISRIMIVNVGEEVR